MLETGGQGRVGERFGALEIADVDQHQWRSHRGGDERRRVGPTDHEREVSIGLQRPRHLGDGVVTTGDARLRVHATHGYRRPGLEQSGPRPQHERRQAVVELDGAVGKRDRGVGDEQPDRAERHQPRVRGKARQHIAGVDAVAGKQTRHQARRGKPPGHVVLQIRVQPSVARVQFGRRAYRQRRGVERVEAEAIDRL